LSLLEVRNLVKHFGGLAAISGVSFDVQQGTIFGLIGPNGSGKTTIFDLISNYHRPTSGTIHFKGHNITGVKTHKICKLGIGRTFQLVKPFGRITVLDNVIASAFCKARAKGEARHLALETLEFCGLVQRKNVLAKSLPLGDRKRLEIARAMATKPDLLLLDETAAGLNPSELDGAIDLIKKIRDKGLTVIIVEHIMKVVMSISDRIHVISFGKTIAEGAPQEVANSPAVIEAYLGKGYAQGS
jgi:branched-chain amino acid transport system ATP-binding protein